MEDEKDIGNFAQFFHGYYHATGKPPSYSKAQSWMMEQDKYRETRYDEWDYCYRHYPFDIEISEACDPGSQDRFTLR